MPQVVSLKGSQRRPENKPKFTGMHPINFTLIVAAIAATGTLAHTQDYFEVSTREHQWRAPRATDVRSPCPGLNTYVEPLT
jgi:hypothetical protein